MLPVLRTILQATDDTELGNQLDLSNTAFVCVQHLLRTTEDLFQALIELGADPLHIHLLGKVYSTHNDTRVRLRDELGLRVMRETVPLMPGSFGATFRSDVASLWNSFRNHSATVGRVVILDDGGYVTSTAPSELENVVAVEQTRSGDNQWSGMPVIQVSASAAKTVAESPLIAEAVMSRIATFADASANTPKSVFGVIGIGNIGAAVAQCLIATGCHVITYDKNPKVGNVDGVNHVSSLRELVEQADVIFGCTGYDITSGFDADTFWMNWSGNKTLVSCSSGDTEFLQLLRTVAPATTAGTFSVESPLSYRAPGGNLDLTILRGGFPINFDGSPHSVPPQDIQLTRGLLLAGLIQALCVDGLPRERRKIMLDPDLQRFVLRAWMANQPDRRFSFSRTVLDGFGDLEWIKANSEGDMLQSKCQFSSLPSI